MNSIPLTEGRRAHFVGIGGIGMSALARLMAARGYEVSGSDASAGGQFKQLRDEGLDVRLGHEAQNVEGADLVVVTSAVPENNPELEAARRRGIVVVKRAELLAHIFNPSRGVAVAGTHGKTTTTALIGWILLKAGLDPTVIVGGVANNLSSNLRIGRSDLVVAEADEYDASFLRLRPEIGVMTNVEADHLDFYKSLEAVHDAFRAFSRSVSRTLIVNAEDEFLTGLEAQSPTQKKTFGLTCGDFRAERIEEGSSISFSVRRNGTTHRFRTPLAGKFNVLNALAAITVAGELGIPDSEIGVALESFKGVERRLEVRGERNGVLVIDTYAHHPTEIAANVDAVRHLSEREVRVIFQPHTFSRTKYLLDDLAKSLTGADRVYLLDVYAARESEADGIGAYALYKKVRELGSSVIYCQSGEEAVDLAMKEARPGDVVVTMGAGDVDRLVPSLLHGS